ncbi:MAG: M23 family metallopeptidase [Deltaproteobacteria bacterium]|jgi:murein DD-endopeptidase MepM/ murein hydrolase activator NlpD|nr:M23 family metallopeptidase [Deltaproteobacteria bacterium]
MQKNKFFFFYTGTLLLLVCLGIAHLISMEHDLPQARLLSPSARPAASAPALPSSAYAVQLPAASAPILITPDTEIVLELSDATSGLRSVQANLLLAGDRLPLLVEEYKDNPLKHMLRLKIDPQLLLHLKKGQPNQENQPTPPDQPVQSVQEDLQITLEVKMRDNSTADWWRGNYAVFSFNFRLDRTPPQAAVVALSGKIKQGGSAALVFLASEPLRSAQLEAGGHTFKAYTQANGLYACLFAFPYQVQADNYRPELVLEDQAGYITRQPLRPLGLEVTAKAFRPDVINLSEKFLAGKAGEFARLVNPDPLKSGIPAPAKTAGADPVKSTDTAPVKAASGASNPLDLFLTVNSSIREQNYARLAKYSEQTAPAPLWRGVFMRLPRSVQLSQFADQRSYMYQGREVDHRTHQGIDLASVSRDQIPAAGSGRILAAGYLGIHGNMVLIDHGLGLQTLYSHLSESKVTQGENVKKGQIIGLTGKSGMAGGDHLHFEILLSGISVKPDEWLNPAWSERIEDILLEAR